MAGISNMLNIMKRQVYKKTSKIKLVLMARNLSKSLKKVCERGLRLTK